MEKFWLKNYPSGVPHDIDFGNYSNLLDVVQESVKSFGDKPAFTNMGKTLTFHQVDRLSDYFGAFLQNELGLKEGDRFAIQMPNLLQYPIALIGAFKAGLIVVNVNPLYTAREMEHQLNDSGAKAILILANSAHLLQGIQNNTTVEKVIVTEVGDMLNFPKNLLVNSIVKYVKKMVPNFEIVGSYKFMETLEIGRGLDLNLVKRKLDDIAFLQYTGGTTGVSKGAMLTHKNIIANMLQIAAWMSPLLERGKEILITPLPLYHIFSLTVNCMAMMSYGVHNILITNPRDLKTFLKEMSKWRFTINAGLNTLFNAMLHHPDLEKVDFKSCKFSVAGGMALQKAVAEEWKKNTGSPIIEGYGLTETSPVVSVNPLDGKDKLGTIGMPVPSTEIKIVNEEGKECGLNEPGELWVRGPQVMTGYWQREDETKNVLTEDGWLKTGDISQIDEDGFLKIVDRKKDMILVSGFNVYPNEIEDVMVKMPQIMEVAAVGIPDEKSGEVVKIFVVQKAPVTVEQILKYARENLTGYKVPKHVEFRKELPKSNVGKILRRMLKEPAAENSSNQASSPPPA